MGKGHRDKPHSKRQYRRRSAEKLDSGTSFYPFPSMSEDEHANRIRVEANLEHDESEKQLRKELADERFFLQKLWKGQDNRKNRRATRRVHSFR